MDMKKFLQAVDGSSDSKKPVEGSDDLAKFLRVVSEADINQPAPAAATGSTLPPEQISYNQLRAQLDSLAFLQGDTGRNTFVSQDPELVAKQKAMQTKLDQLAAALKTKGIDAAAEYDAPEPGAAPATDLKQKYFSKNAAPVAEGNISTFLSIVDKNDVEKLMEGRGPLNRLTQAESITMNTYSEYKPTEKSAKPSLIDKYFKEVETEFAESLEKKQEKVKQLAERVIEKVTEVGGNYGHPSNLRKHISQAQRPPEDIIRMAKSGAKTDKHTRRYHKEETEGVDSVTLDVPLMIRLLEFAREDAQDDMTLHQVVERMIGMKEEGQALSMSDYDAIVGKVDEAHPNSKIYDKCWTGYKKVPGKKRGEPGSCEKK